ncbi:MAG: hypothetical protein VB108_02290 [Anaerolineaceae bacterium]|nr:hypothetical protein [Anaerolineaceae bacterium]
MEKEPYPLFVGGEFYADNRWQTDRKTLATDGMTFLSGGRACLMVTAAFLRDHGISRILLPSYLCPSILNTFEACGLSWDFYAINPDFSMNLQSILSSLKEHQAFYFINYFGFTHNPSSLIFMNALKHSNVLLIEDNAQLGFLSQTTGHFVLNSMRKLCPQDGGYLQTRFDLQPYLSPSRSTPNRRLPIIREYRRKLRDYLFSEKGSFEELQSLFEMAETYYVEDSIILGDEQERWQIERLDWDAIKTKRRQNYHELLQLIAPINYLQPIFPNLQADAMPLGLPVYVNGIPRDELNDYLGENSIGLTIHWDDILTHPVLMHNTQVHSMASKILTLPVDQYTEPRQLNYLVEKLKTFAK